MRDNNHDSAVAGTPAGHRSPSPEASASTEPRSVQVAVRGRSLLLPLLPKKWATLGPEHLDYQPVFVRPTVDVIAGAYEFYPPPLLAARRWHAVPRCLANNGLHFMAVEDLEVVEWDGWPDESITDADGNWVVPRMRCRAFSDPRPSSAAIIEIIEP